MKLNLIFTSALTALLAMNGFAQTEATVDADQKRAADWVATLKLDDTAKAARITEVVTTHLKTVRDWHNAHPGTSVPAGINPITGKKLNEVEREVIADSAMPKTAHETLMNGLHKDLSEEQVAAMLDKYTIGKVAFTMTGYRAIITNLTPDEEKMILTHLQQAREEAVDYKNMKEISTIFKIHKTQIEQYLNDHGRDWKQLYKTYVDSLKTKKASAAAATNAAPADQ